MNTKLTPLAAAVVATLTSSLASAWVCDTSPTPVYDVQGDGDHSPLVPDGSLSGGQVVIEGVVTKKATSLYKGFFVQDINGDNDPATSDGIFVYSKDMPAGVEEGDHVCLQGQVREYYGQTQLSLTSSNIEIIEENVAPPEPAVLELDPDLPLEEQLEPYEGMLVTTSDSGLVVTRNFGFDYSSYRNNMVLSLEKPLFKPTQKFPALSPEAKALAAENSKGQLFVDTDQKPENGVVPYFEDFNAYNGYVRIGDKIESLEGVIGYSYGEFRLIPETGEDLEAADFVHNFSDRKEYPDVPYDSDLKVASFNVLNYFNSGVGGDSNPLGQNRGAGDNVEDFTRQRTKIINAIVKIDADIVGLLEIENNGFGANSAIQNLVNGINDALPNPADHYQFVQSPDGQHIGTDAIAVGMLFRPARVQLASTSEIIEMPTQQAEYQGTQKDETVTKTLFKGQRNSLLQEFEVPLDDGSVRSLSVVINHFKSKGSQCFNDYNEYLQPIPLTSSGRIDTKKAKRVVGYEDDLQGSCNEFRLSAAEVLGNYMREHTAGDVLVMGDLNAYGKEDPVRLLTDYSSVSSDRALVTAPYTFIGDRAYDGEQGRELTEGYGYINLAEMAHGTEAFSYSYDGELGSLDHILGSGSITPKVADVTDWHINSLENTLFEYSRKYSGDLQKADNSFSSSDHDPVILSLDYSQSVIQPVVIGALPDARVTLETTGLKSDSFARQGQAKPEYTANQEGYSALFSGKSGLLTLAAAETLGEEASLSINSVTTAWAVNLLREFTKDELFSLSKRELVRAKLNVKRSDVTRAAIAVELSKELGLDSAALIEAVLDNPRASHQKVLIKIMGLEYDRRALQEQVHAIKSEMQPAVRSARRALIRG
ncbi:ExeM/NucH family extracellular endonuclease [Parendozoicomonas sp. Alg238-R29]|uniref:ExeM/NucH family extracellular endonuclease n=1 Tax=Parendozoicomonas sp. Alg238-R29 TaxID=2993446 RepID=UPI00248EB007|nr:ExeM/NucH family extracellular endonuclease [Parendozoicomonas sp. Alg238-R29]